MPKVACRNPGCPSFASYRGYCGTCRPSVIRSKEDGPRIYALKRWNVLRAAKLAQDSVCEECGKELATEVHHIQAINDGGEPWAIENLASLCKPCHSRETNREVRERVYQ